MSYILGLNKGDLREDETSVTDMRIRKHVDKRIFSGAGRGVNRTPEARQVQIGQEEPS